LPRATLLVVCAGLFWRTVRYGLAFPLWGDEAYVAVNLLTRDLAGLSRPLEYFQIAPPGFLWVEWLAVRLFGISERALRLVPYLAGMASLLLFWNFCRQVASSRTVLVAVAVMAASFYPVRHSTEVKPYAIDLLVSLLLMSTGWGVVRETWSYRAWLALIAISSAGVWCSYTAVFPMAAVASCLGLQIVRMRSARLVTVWLAFVIVIGLVWMTMFNAFARPQAQAAAFLPHLQTWRDAFPPLARPWRLPWWLVDMHTGNMLAYPYGANHFGSVLTTLLVLAGCIRVARRRARRPLLCLLLGAIPAALVAAGLHQYPYGTSTRVMLYLAPAFCLLTGEGVMAVLQLRRWANRGPLIVGGMLAIVPLVCTAFNVAMPYKAYDDVLHRDLSLWLAAHTRPGDEWIVCNGASPPPLVTDLMVLPWLQRVGEAHYNLLARAAVPVRWEPDPRAVIAKPSGITWLIIQNHGDAAFFPVGRLAGYQRALEERLGQPRVTTRFALPRNERWAIHQYGQRARSLPR
jgi:hypothetical protein